MIEFNIKPEDAGIRLDRWFKRNMPQVTHGILEKSLRKGQVRLNGKKAESSVRIEEGQTITMPDEFASITPQVKTTKAKYTPSEDRLKELRQAILYNDAHMLVLNKPAGLAVQGGSGQKEHLDGMLPFLTGEDLKLVHRLDKDTSGVLILAKGANAAGKIAKLFASKEVEKIYHALVLNVPKPRQGVINLPLMKEISGPNSFMSAAYEVVSVNESEGQKAITEYKVIEPIGNKLAWVELKPITGRTHQLRVHMREIECPIIGDGKYGGSSVFMKELGLPEKLHLHAKHIIIPQWNGKKLKITAPLPKHMELSKKLLGGSDGV